MGFWLNYVRTKRSPNTIHVGSKGIVCNKYLELGDSKNKKK